MSPLLQNINRTKRGRNAKRYAPPLKNFDLSKQQPATISLRCTTQNSAKYCACHKKRNQQHPASRHHQQHTLQTPRIGE